MLRIGWSAVNTMIVFGSEVASCRSNAWFGRFAHTRYFEALF